MEIVFAGFGGQGVLTTGIIMAYMAMKNGKEVMWSPAYGAEMRGGKAYSLVKFSDDPIEEPVITQLDALVAMSPAALDFCTSLKPGAVLILNSDVIDRQAKIPEGFRTIWLPVATLATKAGAQQSANIVTIGALVRLLGSFEAENARQILCEYFEHKGKAQFNDSNEKAFQAGYDYIVQTGQKKEE